MSQPSRTAMLVPVEQSIASLESSLAEMQARMHRFIAENLDPKKGVGPKGTYQLVPKKLISVEQEVYYIIRVFENPKNPGKKTSKSCGRLDKLELDKDAFDRAHFLQHQIHDTKSQIKALKQMIQQWETTWRRPGTSKRGPPKRVSGQVG